MILNTHPENRKDMVKAICELTGMNATYLFTPTYAYQVGPITVSRDGSIDCEDEAMIDAIKPMLIERGWLEAEETPEAPADFKDMPETAAPISVEQMDITMPISGWTVAQATNLLRMLCSKQILINRMLGCDMLSIEESFVQAMSENPPESTADLEAHVQEVIEAGSICGFRFSDGQVMPGVESGNTPILFGDFKKAYINDCGKRGFKRMHELYAVNDHVGFMLGERVGIKLMVPDAIKGLKVA